MEAASHTATDNGDSHTGSELRAPDTHTRPRQACFMAISVNELRKSITRKFFGF